jgi:hypothetical protein
VEIMHVPGNVAVSTINNPFRVLVRINIQAVYRPYMYVYVHIERFCGQ